MAGIEEIKEDLRTKYHVELGPLIGDGGAAWVYGGSLNGVASAFKISKQPVGAAKGLVEKEFAALEVIKSVSGDLHIVDLRDVWMIKGHLVTRWERGDQSLADRLRECQQEGRRGIPAKELLGYMHEVAEGLDELNFGRGIFHRDIKPANLLLFGKHVKITDLGLAKFQGATSQLSEDSLVGTLGYIPPEVGGDPENDRGGRLTRTSDLYSLAATYVTLRTGHGPFGESFHEVARRQLAGRPILKGLTSAEAKLVRRALAPQPEDRPQDGAAAWVGALAAAVGASGRLGPRPPVGPPEPGPNPQPQKPHEKVKAGLSLVCLVQMLGITLTALRATDDVETATWGLVPLSVLGLGIAVASARAHRRTGVLFGLSAPAMLVLCMALSGHLGDDFRMHLPGQQGPTSAWFLGYWGVSIPIGFLAIYRLLRAPGKAAARGGWFLRWLLCLLLIAQVGGIAGSVLLAAQIAISLLFLGLFLGGLGILIALLSARARIRSGILFGLSAPAITSILWCACAWLALVRWLGIYEPGFPRYHGPFLVGALAYAAMFIPVGMVALHGASRIGKNKPRPLLALFLTVLCLALVGGLVWAASDIEPRLWDYMQSLIEFADPRPDVVDNSIGAPWGTFPTCQIRRAWQVGTLNPINPGTLETYPTTCPATF